MGDRWPVRPAEQAWDLRQAQYHQWLSDRTGLLFVARDEDLAPPVGYTFCLLSGAGPTFDFGETRAEVDSLVVADTARGAGIGTMLLDACRAELRRRAIRYWSIGVVDANERGRIVRAARLSSVYSIADGHHRRGKRSGKLLAADPPRPSSL